MNALHNCERCGHLKLRSDGRCPECGTRDTSRWQRTKATLAGAASILLPAWGFVPLYGFFRFGSDPVAESAVRCIVYLSPMLVAIGFGLYAARRGDLAARILGVVGLVFALLLLSNFVIWVVDRP